MTRLGSIGFGALGGAITGLVVLGIFIATREHGIEGKDWFQLIGSGLGAMLPVAATFAIQARIDQRRPKARIANFASALGRVENHFAKVDTVRQYVALQPYAKELRLDIALLEQTYGLLDAPTIEMMDARNDIQRTMDLLMEFAKDDLTPHVTMSLQYDDVRRVVRKMREAFDATSSD